MNVYNLTTSVGDYNANKGRPTIGLIKLYRALHDIGLKQAKDIVEEQHPDKDRTNYSLSFILDDEALGRVLYTIHSDRRNVMHIESLERINNSVNRFGYCISLTPKGD